MKTKCRNSSCPNLIELKSPAELTGFETCSDQCEEEAKQARDTQVMSVGDAFHFPSAADHVRATQQKR